MARVYLSEKAIVFEIHNENLQVEKFTLYDVRLTFDLRVRGLTSSSGSSESWDRELESRPTMNGVGVQTMSSMAAGNTGM